VKGGPTYSYKVGPDGKRYAVEGEVSIDTSKESDPAMTLQKMRTVQRAALAPAKPSSQDRMVAAKAAIIAAQAQREMIEEQIAERQVKEAAKGPTSEQPRSPVTTIDLYV